MPLSLQKRRKKGRTPGSGSTSPAHLDAVLQRAEALHAAGRADEALQVLEANLARLGGYAALRAALAMTYGALGRSREAAVQARLALEMDPRRPEYYLLGAVAYFSAGYHTLAHRARQQWLRNAPAGPLVSEMRLLDDDYEAGAREIMTRYRARSIKEAEEAGFFLDEGRWALDRDDWTAALRFSQKSAALAPGWPPPRNNASTALYYLRRYDEAIWEAEAVLRECDPDNLHALANLVRYCVVAGDSERARQCAERVAAMSPREDLGDVVKQIEGLAFVDRDADIARIAADARKRFGDLPNEIHVHWGVALANFGRRREALKHLRRAQEAGNESALLETTLEAVEQGRSGPGVADHFPQTHCSDLMGREVLEEIAREVERKARAGQPDPRGWADLLRRNPQLPLVLGRMLYEAPDTAPAMIEVLQSLPAPAAVQALRAFATGRAGSQADRMHALDALQEIGTIGRDADVEMWIGGEQRTIRLTKQEISEDFVPDYPPEAADLYNRALDAHRDGRIEKAERLYEAMLKIAPNAKEAYNNLAIIYSKRGESERADACLDKALEIDPLYPFPICGRALQALARDDIEGAKALLAPLHQVNKWQPLAFGRFQVTRARVAIAEHDYQAARHHLDIAAQFSEDPEISKLKESLIFAEGLSGFGGRWREQADAYRRRRQKAPLSSDPTLEECFGLLTKGDMTGIRHTLRVGGASTLKKGELGTYLMDLLRDEVFLAGVTAQLDAAGRAALVDLLEHGGVMNWQSFAEAHGDDLGESPYLEYHAEEMQTVMGRLRTRGLLFEGTDQGALIVALPRELRPLLRESLEQAQPPPGSG
jgi:tetratricopeptide (TPR) repeat protein